MGVDNKRGQVATFIFPPHMLSVSRFLNQCPTARPLDFLGLQQLGRTHHKKQRLSSESVRKIVWLELFRVSKSWRRRVMSPVPLRHNSWRIWERTSSRSKSRNEETHFADGGRGTMPR